MTYFKKSREEDCLLVQPNELDGFRLTECALSDLLYDCRPKDCVLFLSDGGLAKTTSAHSIFAGLFTQDRWVMNFNGKLLTKLRRDRRKSLTIEDIKGPIVEGAISHFVKLLKQGKTSIAGRKLRITFGEKQAEFRIVGAVVFFKYLFLASPMSKMFALSQLKKTDIPVVCITTDAHPTAINMIVKALRTDCVFGFTEKTIELLSKAQGMSLGYKADNYLIFEEGISIPSAFGDAEIAFSRAKHLLENASTSRERDTLMALRAVYREVRRSFFLIRASSLPANEVLYYSRLASELSLTRQKIKQLIAATAEPQLSEAAAMLDAGLAIAAIQMSRTEKTEAIKSFLKENTDFILVTATRPEAVVAKDYFSVRAEPMRDITEGDKIVFSGLYSTWRFLDVVRRVKPTLVRLIGWSSEVDLYEDFRQNYSKASEILYKYDLALAKSLPEGRP
jgi:hypothetical protein